MSESLIRRSIEEGWIPENDAERRLARRVPWVVDALEDRVIDPIDRALVGLGLPKPAERSVTDRVRIAVAEADGGAVGSAAALAALEDAAAATNQPEWMIPAARLHARVSTEREARARMALSDQSLPYVFPGDVHPLMVDVLACGERILPALHVDWLRKLTTWLAPSLAADCAAMGLWFWPVLDVLDSKKIARELTKRLTGSVRPGSRGLVAAYGTRLALDLDPGPHPGDRRIHALALLGNAVN